MLSLSFRFSLTICSEFILCPIVDVAAAHVRGAAEVTVIAAPVEAETITAVVVKAEATATTAVVKQKQGSWL